MQHLCTAASSKKWLENTISNRKLASEYFIVLDFSNVLKILRRSFIVSMCVPFNMLLLKCVHFVFLSI